MTDWSLVRQMAEPFPDTLVRKPPVGKHGVYVKHSDVAQRLLSIVGFYDFEVVEIVRGHAPAIVDKNTGEINYPARDGAVVGVLARLTINTNSRRQAVTEAGTEDNPAMHTDGESLKNATSDAFKRCAMRFGLGLHLWSPDSYFLPQQIDHDHPQVRETPGPSHPTGSSSLPVSPASPAPHQAPGDAAETAGTGNPLPVPAVVDQLDAELKQKPSGSKPTMLQRIHTVDQLMQQEGIWTDRTVAAIAELSGKALRDLTAEQVRDAGSLLWDLARDDLTATVPE